MFAYYNDGCCLIPSGCQNRILNLNESNANFDFPDLNSIFKSTKFIKKLYKFGQNCESKHIELGSEAKYYKNYFQFGRKLNQIFEVYFQFWRK